MSLVGTLGKVFNVQVRFGADTSGFMGKMAKMGAVVTNIGRTMSLGLTLPIVAIGVNAVRMAANFEQSMNKVAAVTQATVKEMELLNSVAQELGRTTKFSASQAADGMSFLAMAGFEVNEIAGAMPAVLDLAAAANMDLAQAADIASNIMTGYEMQVSELSGAIDVMAGAFTGSNTDLQQLGEAMAYVGPIAAGLQIPFEETAAVLGMFGNAGIQASRAGTSMRMGLLRLIDPPGDAAAALDALGVSTIDVEGNFRGLSQIMIDLATIMEERGYTSTQRLATMMEIFGTRAGAPFAAVLSQGTDELLKFVDALEDTQGLAKDIADTQMEGLNGQITKLKSAFEGLMIAIGDSGILGAITELAEKTTVWIAGLAKADPAMIKLAVQIAGVIALLGPLLMLLGQIIAIAPAIGAAVTFMFGPWGLVIGGVVGLITLAINAYNKSAKEAQVETDKFRESLETQLGILEQTNTDIETLNTSFNELKDSVVDNEEKFNLFKDKLQEIIDDNPKFIDVLEDIEIHGGELYDVTGDLITSWDELQGKWDRADSGNVVVEIDRITGAIDRLARAEFMESRSWIESMARRFEWDLDPEQFPTIVSRREQEWEELVTTRLNEMNQDMLSGFGQQPDRFRGVVSPDEIVDEIVDEIDRVFGGGASSAASEGATAATEELTIAEMKLEGGMAALLERMLEAKEILYEEIRARKELLQAIKDEENARRERKIDAVADYQLGLLRGDKPKPTLTEEERAEEQAEADKEDEIARIERAKEAADKFSDQLEDALLGGINSIIRSIASGNIGQAIGKLFTQLGNIIAQQVSQMTTEAIGGGGMWGSIAGAAVGGVVGLGISAISNAIFGGKEIPGATMAKLSYVFITNWEDYFKFGYTLPSSYVLSGRSDQYGVDPHGRVLDYAFGGWEDGEHFDV